MLLPYPQKTVRGNKMNWTDVEKYLMKISSDLGVDVQKLRQEYKNDKIHFIEDEIPYFRFKKDIGTVEEGTVVFLLKEKKELEYVRGYPKIPRALIIETAFKKNFEKAYVEEKLNGYNIRTVKINGRIKSLTKGGLVCNYTSKRIEELIKDSTFFNENPELMLCGEVVGLQNPYQEKSYPEAKDFGYFVFDIRNRKTGEPLPVEKKMEMVKKYGLKMVHSFGIFSDGKELLKLVRKLGDEGREGIVLKSPDMSKQMKYTSNQSTNEDLRYAFTFYSDYGLPFMYRRLIREAFQAYELGLDGEDLEKEANKLGKSVLIPMVKTIRQVAEGKEVTEDFEIDVPDMIFAEDFVNRLKHLGVKATIEGVEKSKSGKSIIVKVSRHYPSTNDKTKAYLEGGFCRE